MFFVLVCVSAIVFFALRLGPFDPAAQAAEATLGDEQRLEELREYWGLDEPLVIQYLKYLRGILIEGDFGRSLQDLQPVTTAIADRLPATVELALMAMVIGTLLGIGVGVWAAYKRDTHIDTGARSLSLIGTSFPTFWLGVVAIAIFAVNLEWFPAGGRISSEISFDSPTGFYIFDSLVQRRPDVTVDVVQHLILPASVLGLLVTGMVARITRASMLESMGKDFVRTALAKGATPRRAALAHALPNALLPIITVLALMFGLLLSGAVVVETVFAFPGMGKLLVDSISVRDFPQIQASILVLAAMYSIINAMADVVYVTIDPRVRLQ